MIERDPLQPLDEEQFMHYESGSPNSKQLRLYEDVVAKIIEEKDKWPLGLTDETEKNSRVKMCDICGKKPEQ